MDDGLFDSDLSYQDAVENFFAWKKQAVVGAEMINNVNCQILESKPDSSSASIYGKVRSWIDPRRFVPLRIEKYSSSGELVRRIDITRIARDEKDHPIPAQSHCARTAKEQRDGIQWRAHRPGREFYRRRFHAGRHFEIARASYLFTASSTSRPALSRSASASRGPINCRLVGGVFASRRGTGTASAGLPAKLTATVFCT